MNSGVELGTEVPVRRGRSVSVAARAAKSGHAAITTAPGVAPDIVRCLYRCEKLGRVELSRVLGVDIRPLHYYPDTRSPRANGLLNGRRSVAGAVGVEAGEGGARVAGTAGARSRPGFLDQADVEVRARFRFVPQVNLGDRIRPRPMYDGGPRGQWRRRYPGRGLHQAEVATSQLGIQRHRRAALGGGSDDSE